MNKCLIVGSGYSPLNFKVVGGSEAPLRPIENTIWVKTGEKITGWVLTALVPDAPTEGVVWIRTASEGGAGVNLLKKNAVSTHVVSAQQYVGGEWVVKTVKVYQNGQWQNTETYLYYKGNLCEELTGGWTSSAVGSSAEYNTPSAPNITYNSDHVEVHGTGAKWASGCWNTVNKIDLTDFSRIRLHVIATNSPGAQGNIHLRVATLNGPYIGSNVVASAGDLEGNSNNDVFLDISSITGECYVRIDTYVSVWIKLDEIELIV